MDSSPIQGNGYVCHNYTYFISQLSRTLHHVVSPCNSSVICHRVNYCSVYDKLYKCCRVLYRMPWYYFLYEYSVKYHRYIFLIFCQIFKILRFECLTRLNATLISRVAIKPTTTAFIVRHAVPLHNESLIYICDKSIKIKFHL